MKTKPKILNWWLYLIEAQNGSFYTGITTDPERRMKQHQGNDKIAGKGAKFFNRTRPKRFRYRLSGLDRSLALKLEYRIKKLKPLEKLKLIESNYDLDELKLFLRID